MTAAPCHHDRGLLTTHYKYITAEKRVIVCKLDYINLQDIWWIVRLENLGINSADSVIRKVQPSWIEKANGSEKSVDLIICFFSAVFIEF